MAKTKKEPLNPLTDKPKSLADVTLMYMHDFIDKKGSLEDAEWFMDRLDAYWGMKYNNLAKKEIEGVTDIPALRREFALRFFPQLVDRKRTPNKQSYRDMVKAMVEKKKK
ncbi:MAG: hypothetical protein IJH53_10280 [Oscillospiraceae bacterium]|nr:hypothetical protein [Oscillospiraceae bacterium]